MKAKPPPPVCRAFFPLRTIFEDPNTKETVLVGPVQKYQHHKYPAAVPIALFGRCTSGHGEYRFEVQLQTSEGETVWHEGPPGTWSLDDPLKPYDLKLSLCPIFPQPGVYDFVLLANGEEVARHPFRAELVSVSAGQSS